MFDNLLRPEHLLIIAVIALLVFGPRKLPELGKGLGEGWRGFKEGLRPQPEGAKQEDAAAKSDAVTTQQTPPSETKA